MVQINRQTIIDYALLSPIYLSSIVLFTSPIEFYISYVAMIGLLPVFTYKYGLPKAVIYVMIALLLVGLLGVSSGKNELSDLIKIWLNLLIAGVYFYQLFQYFKKDIKRLLKLYLNLSLVISVLGIIQILAYGISLEPIYSFFGIFNKWGISYGGVFGIRLNSIFSEPSYFGSAIAPAFVFAAYSLMFSKRIILGKLSAIIIIIAYVLTFSTVSYIGIFITLILLLINYGLVRYALFVFPILFGAYYYLYNNVLEFKVRVDGITSLVSGEANSAFDVHGSSFVLYNNFTVTIQNLKRNPLFGSGLGSHQHAYDEFSVVKEFGGIYDFNSQDANSMFLRIASETGVFGVLLTFIFIFSFFVKRKEDFPDDFSWLASSACLVIIMLQLARQGNYTFNGFFFFIWLYYYIHQEHKNNRFNLVEDLNSGAQDSAIPIT